MSVVSNAGSQLTYIAAVIRLRPQSSDLRPRWFVANCLLVPPNQAVIVLMSRAL